MRKFKFIFNGRLSGSLGVTSNVTETVEADTLPKAWLRLYDKYESCRLIHAYEEVNGVYKYIDNPEFSA